MSEAPPPTPSRKQILCDHCGKSMKKKKLQEHTTRVHGTKVIPRERQLSGQTKLNFSKRETETSTNDKSPKRIKSDECDLKDSLEQMEEDLIDNDNDESKETTTKDSQHADAETNEDIKNDIKLAKEDLKADIKMAKEVIISAIKNNTNENKTQKSDTQAENKNLNTIMNSARTVIVDCG